MEQSELEKSKINSQKDRDISGEKLDILDYLKTEIETNKDILSALVYGSWLYSEKSADLDICVIIPSEDGIVEPDVYRRLKIERGKLSEKTAQSVDLVPHTMDEISDFRSDLHFPRHNPSLVSGPNIKGDLEIKPIFDKNESFTYADLAAHVLLDNRTICRRQIIRSLSPEESKIFSSKLLHGPGNALTYYSCKQKEPYLIPPSNWEGSINIFDLIYEVDSKPAYKYLLSCKNELSFGKASILLKWYEHLVAMVLHEDSDGKQKRAYQEYCLEIKNISTEK